MKYDQTLYFHERECLIHMMNPGGSTFWILVDPCDGSWRIHMMDAGGKIYYCRLVRLGLWETFHNRLCGNIIPRRLVGTLSVITSSCSHKIYGQWTHTTTTHNKPSGTKPKLSGNTCCMCLAMSYFCGNGRL